MGVGEWIAQAVQALIPMFYVAETGLTFLGVLGVAGLSFSVIFLIINTMVTYNGDVIMQTA